MFTKYFCEIPLEDQPFTGALLFGTIAYLWASTGSVLTALVLSIFVAPVVAIIFFIGLFALCVLADIAIYIYQFAHKKNHLVK